MAAATNDGVEGHAAARAGATASRGGTAAPEGRTTPDGTTTPEEAAPPGGGSPGRRRRRRRTIAVTAAALSLLLALLLAGCGAVLYAAFLRKPANDPAAFLERGRSPGTRTVVVSAGSSTTHASLSGDYVAMLRGRLGGGYDVVNAGVNGTTTESLLGRLEETIACRPDAVTVLVGSNDARDGVPLAAFRANLDAILHRLRTETGARIAVLSLTPHGERLDSAANRALAPYNAAIRELAASHGATYLPLFETMSAALRDRGGDPALEPPSGFVPLAGSAIRHYVGGQSWDEIADANSLLLLTDHIHLSDRGAAIVADLTAGWLEGAGLGGADER